jgi:hypothetical protein
MGDKAAKAEGRLIRPSLYSNMLKRKIRILAQSHHCGRVGRVVNVYLVEGQPFYTAMLKDGRLLEFRGNEIVVEG